VDDRTLVDPRPMERWGVCNFLTPGLKWGNGARKFK
jgi:hypothetical protein